MKFTDLMIGDLVSFNGKAERINIIDTWDNEVSYFDSDAEGVLSFRLDEIEPIPLTEEILKTNGFKFKENDNEWWHYDPFPFSDFQIGYEDEDCNDMRVIFNFATTSIKVNYVHELQHALRFSGLSELSDNFKI